MKKANNFYKLALAEMKKEKPNTKYVVELLEKGVIAKNPNAHYALGTWYLHGEAVKKNVKKGLSLILFAAEHNIASALFDIAVSLEKGIGGKKNLSKAFKYYLKASILGNHQAIYETGRCYYYGIGVPKNQGLATIWLEVAEVFGIE